jgi:two-component system, OmpR family, phosphate regulon sensor histidine kinase PhoR
VINSSVKDNYIQLEILDRGQGFTIKDLPYVFDRLYRGDVSRHQDERDDNMTTSNGLGLAIVKQIVLAHKGTVAASNQPQGGGRVVISMPQQTQSIRRSVVQS